MDFQLQLQLQKLKLKQYSILASAPPLSVVLHSYVYTKLKYNEEHLSQEDLLKYIIEYYSHPQRGASEEEIINAITESLLELQRENS